MQKKQFFCFESIKAVFSAGSNVSNEMRGGTQEWSSAVESPWLDTEEAAAYLKV